MAFHKTLLVALLAVVATLGAPRGTVLVSAQPIKSVRQLHQAYHEIFPSQNRNAVGRCKRPCWVVESARVQRLNALYKEPSFKRWFRLGASIPTTRRRTSGSPT